MEQKETKKDGRGGARVGAGRKAKTDRVCQIGVRVTALAKQRLEAYANSRGISLSDAAVQIFETLDI